MQLDNQSLFRGIQEAKRQEKVRPNIMFFKKSGRRLLEIPTQSDPVVIL